MLLNGPRQCGKTTLVRQFSIEQRRYLTLDDATTCAAARDDPKGFIRRLEGAVIDEVQRVPELLLKIKLAVDDRRRPGCFLLTGSADVMALARVAVSLAGRLEVLSLAADRHFAAGVKPPMASASLHSGHRAGLHRFASHAGDPCLGGVILYDGTQGVLLGTAAGRPVWALTLVSLWHAPSNRSNIESRRGL